MRKLSHAISLCICRQMQMNSSPWQHGRLLYMSGKSFPMIEMAKQWNRLVGETVGYPWYDSLKNSLGAHLSGMPWGIFDAAFDQRAILDHFPVSYPLLLLCVTVKAKGRSEWRGCRKDLERSASESKDSILIENTNLDKGFTNISAVTVKCLYLTVKKANSKCR